MAFQGSLHTISLPDLFSLVCQLKKTGVLSLVTSIEERNFLFFEGNLVYASSRNEKRRLGNFLVRLGFIKGDELDEPMDLTAGDEPYYGRRLLQTGRITRKQLNAAVHAQICDILREVLNWEEGAFIFDDKAPPFEIVDENLISTQSVILEAARMTDEDSFAESLFPDSSIVVRLVEGHDDEEVPEEYREVLSLIDGRRSVDQIYFVSPLGPKNTAAFLKELLDEGALEVVDAETLESEACTLPELRNYPIAPEVPGLIFSILTREGESDTVISKVMATEPMMTAKVLRLLTLDHAEIERDGMGIPQLVEALGGFQMRCLLLPEAARGMYYPIEKSYWKEFWDHTKICAQLSKFLSQQIGYEFPDEAYLAGLMHNMGAFILLNGDPELYQQAVLDSLRTRRDIEDVEREYFGKTHSDVGALYAERWKFPELITATIRDHHSMEGAEENPLLQLIAVSNGLAQASGYRVGYHKELGVHFEESLRSLRLDRRQATALYQHIMRPRTGETIEESEQELETAQA